MAAGSTYTPIATTTLTGNQATVTFNSFSGYTDLVLIGNNYADSLAGVQLRFNSDSGSNYSFTRIEGDGTSASSGRTTNDTGYSGALTSSTNVGSMIYNIQNYANTTTYKTSIFRANSSNGYVQSGVYLWRSTAAITSIQLALTNGGNFISGATFTLYGITAA